MRRTILILTAATLMAMMVVVMAAPAVAQSMEVGSFGGGVSMDIDGAAVDSGGAGGNVDVGSNL